MTISVRRARPDDAGAVARLFHETIHQVNAADYSAAQLRAWSPAVKSATWWRRRFREHQVLVAERGETLVGFAELGADGYIESFFVHHRLQRQGIGKQLMQALVLLARGQGMRRLSADVSITAGPFFRCMGFHSKRPTLRFYHNQMFRQYQMVKTLRR